MSYTRRFQIGQTLDYKPSVNEYRDEFRHGIIFGSWKQLRDEYAPSMENYSSYDERDSRHVLYCVWNQGHKYVTWFYEADSILICNNIERGKKILHANIETFFKDRLVDNKKKYLQMLLESSIPEIIAPCQ